MTPERKAEVNRRLAQFEGNTWSHRSTTRLGDQVIDSTDWEPWYPDYTADLNALARLETKLPHHRWELWCNEKSPAFTVFLNPCHRGEGATEAEARAEAICQYLEQRDEEKVSGR